MRSFPARTAAGLILALTTLGALAEPLPYHRVDFATEVAREVANDQMTAVMSIEISDKDPGRLAQQLNQAVNDALRKAAAFSTVKTSSGQVVKRELDGRVTVIKSLPVGKRVQPGTVLRRVK